ncbi:SIS domain-containing protein [Streptococcus pasteurianus]|uniref:SIS domain-containing protein n=1 Tax=Streptococcus pasteurianus TaxID=197614 RepID=UPI0020BD910C|nr:SIS domain-containing protein [Streptococcus pasteurianus]WCQ69483.1 SIS domain-containing protein [Streptococcus pasteurianus]
MMLDVSHRVYIYGKGSSAQVTNEMKLRFMRLGLVCEAITDDHMMRTNRVLIDETCVVIAISISGETKVVIDSLKDAKCFGAKTILITANQNSELKEISDELILVAVKDSLEYGTTISPQFPILVVVDIFYTYYMNLNRDFRKELFNNSLEALNIRETFYIKSQEKILKNKKTPSLR